MHLTNYSVNKKAEAYVSNYDDGALEASGRVLACTGGRASPPIDLQLF